VTIYQSPEAADRLRSWYPKFLARIDVPTTTRTVPTRYGDTNVLVAGPEDGPPVVLFHGAMASSAHVLSEAKGLPHKFRVYAPDIPGHSPMSADTRPPLDGYGPWGVDVLDALGLATTAMIGVSYGGFVATRTVAAAPDRVTRLSLVVPAGFVSGPAWAGVTRLAIPMAMYRWSPTEARLKRFLDALFTSPDALWEPWLGEALLGFKMDFRAPPAATAGELKAFTRPVQVFGADNDINFPGAPLIEKARKVFPNVVDSELIANCKHSPRFDDEFRTWLSDRLAGFLDPAKA